MIKVCAAARAAVRTHIDICFGVSFRRPRGNVTKNSLKVFQRIFCYRKNFFTKNIFSKKVIHTFVEKTFTKNIFSAIIKPGRTTRKKF